MLAMIRAFLEDTLDLLLDLGVRLRVIRGSKEWWRQRMQRRLERWSGEAENTRRAVRASHRMCRECGALNSASEESCVRCGASMSGIPTGGAKRLAALVLPTFGSVSMTLVGLLVTVYVACAIAEVNAGRGMFSLSGQLLYDLGAMVPFRYADFSWSRLATAIFLHGSVMHIFFNAYALSVLGPRLEEEIGAKRFLFVFVLTGCLSFVGSAVFNDAMSVGASGALFGIIGFGLVHSHLSGDHLLRSDMLRWTVLGFVALPLLGGILGLNADHAAHAAGFIAGAPLGAVLARRRVHRGGRNTERAWGVLALVAGVVPVVAFALAILRAAASN